MLTCLLGRAGAGKTQYIMERVKNDAAQQKKIILMVPEQFSFSAEWILSRALPGSGLFFTQVLSPSRLASRVLANTGGTLTRLDKTGKAMAIKRALMAVRADLTYYRRIPRMDGLSSLMTDMITTLEQCAISPEHLRELAKNAGGEVSLKAMDIALVYEEYLKSIDGRYMDAAAQERLLIERLPQARFIRDYEIYVDGFDVIAPLTLNLIAKLALLCKNVTVTFTCAEAGSRDENLFRPVRDTLARLIKLADDLGVKTVIENMPSGTFSSEAIEHLEHELYAYPFVPYKKETDSIQIIKAATPADECAMVAASIVSLARDRGLKYGDIAVICAESGERPNQLMRRLKKNGVPAVMDKLDTAYDHSAAKQLISAFLAAMSGLMRREDVLGVLKSGYCGIDDDTADLLENYIYENNIFGSRFSDVIEDEDLENAKKTVFDPVLQLSFELRDCETSTDHARAVYNYCVNSLLFKNLIDDDGQQLAQAICDILDQSSALLGNISSADYLRTLKEGLMAATLGSVPNSRDAVSISSVSRFKGNSLKALFVMGLSDGVLPSSTAPENLLTDADRSALKEYLGSSGSEFFAVEAVTIYGALTEPREFLCLSYSGADQSGSALEPSLLIKRIEKIFPNAKVFEPEERTKASFMLTNAESAKSELAFMLKNAFDPAWHSVFSYFENQDAIFADRLRLEMGYKARVNDLAPSQAAQLFSNRISISRLETFAACPYRHFIDYGLKPIERKIPELTPIDSGNFYHDALESFTLRAMAMRDRLNFENGLILMDSVTQPLIERLLATSVGRTLEGRARINALKREMAIASAALVNQLKKSGFTPRNAEVSFGRGGMYPAIELYTKDATLFLEGRIDRLDTANIDGKNFARIVDYKSGHNKLNFKDIYYGTSLQLLTYLDAVTQNGGYEGAGAFYMRVVGDYTKFDINEAPQREDIISSLNKTYRLDGIMLSDDAVIEKMVSGSQDELVNLRLTQNGKPRSDAPVLDRTGMRTLLDFVKEKEKDLAKQVLSGKVDAFPQTTSSTQNACMFCSYKNICHYDISLGSKPNRCDITSDTAKIRILKGGDD